MNKEQYRHVQALRERIDHTGQGVETLAKITSAIQYRRLEEIPEVVRGVSALHQRKQKETLARNLKANGYNLTSYRPPQTFQDRLNNTARRIKTVTLPRLRTLRENLEQHFLEDISLQIYLRMQRTRAGVEFKVIAQAHNPPRPLSTVFGTETKGQLVTYKDVEAYSGAGVPIDYDFVKKIREIDLARSENVGQFIRKERLYREMRLRDLGEAIPYQRVTLSEMEAGKIPVSKAVIKGYEKILGIKVPSNLIEKEREAAKGKTRKVRFASSLRGIQEGNAEPANLGDWLKRERLKAEKSLGELAAKIGRSERNFGLVEAGKLSASDEILAVYAKEVGPIPPNFLEENTRRKEETRRKQREHLNRLQARC